MIAAANHHTPALVLLDANILLPQYLRATFLDLTAAGLLHIHWSRQILVEVRRNLIDAEGPFHLPVAQADKLLALLHVAFPDAVIDIRRGASDEIAGKVDAGDLHVAAAAASSARRHPDRTTFLVTANTRHLPQLAFAMSSIVVAKPDAFLRALLEARSDVADALDLMIRRFERPQLSRETFIRLLKALHCPAFAHALADDWNLSASGRVMKR